MEKISFNAIASRITGLNTPIFGINWTPPPDEREQVRSLLTFLEDRRSLYYPEDSEYFPWVTESILEIRKELTNSLRTAPKGSKMVAPMRAMRAACRKFLDHSPVKPHRTYGMRDINVWTALGELRGVFGVHIASLCVSYGIDPSDELAMMLPIEDKTD